MSFPICRKINTSKLSGEWQNTFDQYYDDTIFVLDEPDFTGWHNSYDGADIPKHEMQAWLDETIIRIQFYRGQEHPRNRLR